MSGLNTLSTDLRTAVDELKATFGPENVTLTHDAGGVWVDIAGIALGSHWEPAVTWLGFHVAATYPYADIYPLFIDGKCQLASGALPPAVSPNATIPTRDEPCVQVSRKSNRWDPTRDTATAKAIKVIDWLRTQ